MFLSQALFSIIFHTLLTSLKGTLDIGMMSIWHRIRPTPSAERGTD
jgi:hypothetical protein